MLLVLSACATTGRGGNGERYWIKSDEASFGMDDSVSLLHYANYVRGLSQAERERETDRQRIAYARDKSDFRRLQYAFALTAGETSANERKLAQQALEPVMDGKHERGMTALAVLLNGHINALTQAQQQGVQQGIQQGVQQGQKRVDELERKLDAVKDIERSLLRREKGKL
jgi:hypothetical protein